MTSYVITDGYFLRSTIEEDVWHGPGPPRCRLDELVWITPSGASHPWPQRQPANIEGRGIPPVIMDEKDVLGDGVSQGQPRFGPREIHIPFNMTRAPEQIRRQIRAWSKALAADRRLGTLLVRTLLNDDRQIRCRYAGGLELVEANNNWITAGVTLRAPEPFWEDAAETTRTWSPTTENTNFFPIPNPTTGSFITLSQGNVITTVEVDNSGDMEAWPVWEVTGPGSGEILLEHVGLGQAIAFSRALGPGETITIDTRPGVSTVRAADGTNEFRSLGLSQLFPLTPGSNTIRISIRGAEISTTVSLRFRRQWLTA